MSLNHPSKQSGVSLIEVMATLLVFLVGMLGVSLYTTSGLKSITASQDRASSIKIGSQGFEPLFYHTRPDCVQMMLGTFPRTVKGDNDKVTTTVRLLNAVDGTGTVIANASGVQVASGYTGPNTGVWITPITVTLSVPYTGLDGATVLSTPTFSIPLQNYGGNCND